jgi:hypothetical protein
VFFNTSKVGRNQAMIRSIQLAAIVGTAALCASGAWADDSDTIAFQKAITLPGGKSISSFDISWVDPLSRVYLLADRTNASVDLVDLNTDSVTVISPTGSDKFNGLVSDPNVDPAPNDVSGPNGVVTVNNVEAWAADAPTFSGPIVKNADPKIAYATDNCDSSVKVIDLISQQVTDSIDIGGCFRSDEVAFDPRDQVFIVANPGEQDIGKGPTKPFVTLVSTKPVAPGQHHQILATIVFDGSKGTPQATNGIEQPVWNPKDGLFYVAVPQDGSVATKGAVAVIDPGDGKEAGIKVVRSLTVNNCTPNGLALGPKDAELFLGCNAGPVQVVDIKNAHVIKTVSQVASCDEVWFNPADRHYLGACNQQLGIIDAKPVSFDTNIPTNPTKAPGNPHSVAADFVANRIFVPIPKNDTVCGAAPNNGCIAVFAPSNPEADDDID